MNTRIRPFLFRLMAPAMSLAFTGCMTAPEHRAAVQNTAGDRLTVGIVQKDVRLGMPGSDVAALLGAPNIVTTDEQRREVWIYDKIASEVVHSASALSLIPLIGGSGGSLLGGATGGFSRSAGAESRSQRTLTVVIKFDAQKLVRDFAYHSSHF